MSEVIINGKKLSKEDVEALKMALDIYTRLMMGQLSEVGNHLKIAMGDTVDLSTMEEVVKNFDHSHKLLHGENLKGWGYFDKQVSITACKVNKIEQMFFKNFHIVDELQTFIDERLRDNTCPGE